jgi:hypothetical protein
MDIKRRRIFGLFYRTTSPPLRKTNITPVEMRERMKMTTRRMAEYPGSTSVRSYCEELVFRR